MAKLSKSKVVWAINETRSMKQAAKLSGVAYNTFKKYAKLYEVWQPLSGSQGVRMSSTGGFKPVELAEIFSGKHPSYSDTKLMHRCFREGYLAEECGNCGYDEYRPQDMSKPLLLDYLDDDPTNKDLANLRVLCYNCFYLLKLDRVSVEVPKSVKSFQKAVYTAFSK